MSATVGPSAISLPARSWWDVARVLAALDELDEAAGDAVWFSAAGSRCAFLLEQCGVVVLVFAGEWHGPDAQVPLSPRVVGVAAAAARTGEPVTVRILDGATAVAHTGAMQVAIDLVQTSDVPVLPEVDDLHVVAVVDAVALRDALGVVGGVPVDAHGGGGGSAPAPTWLAVEHGRLVLHVDGRSQQAGRTTVSIDARVEIEPAAPGGSDAAPVSIDSSVLASLLRGPDAAVHGEVELAFPQRPDGHVRVWAPSWCAWLPCVDVSVGRLLPRVTGLLADAGLPWEVVDARTVRFGTSERRVRGQLHGGLPVGPPEVLRMSVVLASGVAVSEEVLREVNAANAGLVGIRIWLDRDRVVAGLDLPVDHLADLPVALAQLLGQIDGLGACLGALSPAGRSPGVPIPATPPS